MSKAEKRKQTLTQRIEILEEIIKWLTEQLGHKIGYLQGQLDAHLKIAHNVEIIGPSKKELEKAFKEFKAQFVKASQSKGTA